MIRLPSFKKKQKSKLLNGLSIEAGWVAAVQMTTLGGLHVNSAKSHPFDDGAWSSAMNSLIESQGMKGDVYILSLIHI